MNIILANPRGFCAGVDRAIEITNKALEIFGAPIYVKHEIVHNKYVVDELKEKLSRVGLSFDCKIEGDKGSKTIEVKQFGGRFGKDTDGSDINDDGISHKKEGGLKIEVSHELLQTGTSKVYAKLV